MSTVHAPISDMLVTVKSREIQRGMSAELAGETARAARHFLAAAHLELVLAKDYAQAGQDDMAFRSILSAASCFWRAGQVETARPLFEDLIQNFPNSATTVLDVAADLESKYPVSDSGCDSI